MYGRVPLLAWAGWRLRMPGGPSGGQYHGYEAAYLSGQFGIPHKNVYRASAEVLPRPNANGRMNTVRAPYRRLNVLGTYSLNPNWTAYGGGPNVIPAIGDRSSAPLPLNAHLYDKNGNIYNAAGALIQSGLGAATMPTLATGSSLVYGFKASDPVTPQAVSAVVQNLLRRSTTQADLDFWTGATGLANGQKYAGRPFVVQDLYNDVLTGAEYSTLQTSSPSPSPTVPMPASGGTTTIPSPSPSVATRPALPNEAPPLGPSPTVAVNPTTQMLPAQGQPAAGTGATGATIVVNADGTYSIVPAASSSSLSTWLTAQTLYSGIPNWELLVGAGLLFYLWRNR